MDWITTLKTRSLFQNVCYVILIRDETCKIAELSKRSCHISLIDVHCRKTEHVSRELKTFTNPEPIDLAQSCHKLFNEVNRGQLWTVLFRRDMKTGNYFYRYWLYNSLSVKLNVKIFYPTISEFTKTGRSFARRTALKLCLWQ